jgi:hypothetical protein
MTDHSVARADGRQAALVSRGDLPFILAALACGAYLIYLGRSLTFWHDEWRSISFDGDAVDFLRPVNEHWQTIPLLLYRATFAIVELDSYLPYLAQVVALHTVAVAGAYVLMRRRVGRLGATVLSLPLLLLGVGGENLFWAFQTGFVGSVAFGIWSLVLAERAGRRSAIAASVLLIASLMASAIGLFFVVAVAGKLAVESAGRRGLVVVGLPALVFVWWYAVLGRDAVGAEDLATPGAVARFAQRGIGHSVEVMVGVDRLPADGFLGLAVVAVLAAIVARSARVGLTKGLATGCLLGLVSMYVVIGVGRAGLDFDYATLGRYVYVAAFFLILCAADLVAESRDSIRALTGRRRALLVVVACAILGWVVAVNVNALLTVRTQYQYQADLTRATIDLAVAHRGEPWIDPTAGLDLMPEAAELPGFVERYGTPLEDAYFPSFARTPSTQAYEDARDVLGG